jgi:hypothetical protein
MPLHLLKKAKKTLLIAAVFIVSISAIKHLTTEKNPFITADIHHQLGNQCFEIAAALALAWDNGAEPLFPDLINKTDDNIPTNREQIFWRLNADALPREIA